MVANKQLSASKQEEQWQEHVSGEPQYSPPVPPLAPAKFTGSVYIAGTSQIPPECDDFSASLESSTGSFAQNVAPSGAGTTPGMLGYMFWAAGQTFGPRDEHVPARHVPGRGRTGSSTYSIPVPMPALRQS